MKVIGLDGKEYQWNYQSKKRAKSSKLHQRARTLLKIIFPFDIIYEEVFLTGTKTPKHKGLYCDFYLHSERLLIEVHGEQHYKFNPFHFRDKISFYKAQNRDREKELWAIINDITYIGLPFDESNDKWTERINRTNRDGQKVD